MDVTTYVAIYLPMYTYDIPVIPDRVIMVKSGLFSFPNLRL